MPVLIITTATGDEHAVSVEADSTVSVQGLAGSVVVCDVVRVETLCVIQEAAPLAPDVPEPDEPNADQTHAQIDAITTHAEANEAAKALGVDGFEEKSPNLDTKRAALHDAHQAALDAAA